jgi:hypothetical protein
VPVVYHIGAYSGPCTDPASRWQLLIDSPALQVGSSAPEHSVSPTSANLTQGD